MNEPQDRKYDDPMGRLAVKSALAWHGWGSPIGLGSFLIELGVFLWLLHLANIIH